VNHNIFVSYFLQLWIMQTTFFCSSWIVNTKHNPREYMPYNQQQILKMHIVIHGKIGINTCSPQQILN
jgi:hypothetical protein